MNHQKQNKKRLDQNAQKENKSQPLLGHHLWNYSNGRIELGREMYNYTSTNVSYAKDADIRAAFLTNTTGDECNTKKKKKGVAFLL